MTDTPPRPLREEDLDEAAMEAFGDAIAEVMPDDGCIPMWPMVPNVFTQELADALWRRGYRILASAEFTEQRHKAEDMERRYWICATSRDVDIEEALTEQQERIAALEAALWGLVEAVEHAALYAGDGRSLLGGPLPSADDVRGILSPLRERVAALEERVETEWYNGNMGEDTRDRILSREPAP